jgi:hypothetical protein
MTKRILNTITEYIEPSDLFTEQEQLDQCCEEVSADPCVEVGKSESYVSADIADLDLEKLLNEARAKHPGIYIVDVKVVDVGPKGDCGTKYTDWEGRLNCCDEVEPLAWDSENSVDVIADMSSGVIVVTGGRPPFEISIRGSGFYLDQKGARDGFVDGRNIKVYTSTACGTCTVNISDGCSAVAGSVRSVNGRWSGDCYAYEYITEGLSLTFSKAQYSSTGVGAGCFMTQSAVDIPHGNTLARSYAYLRKWDDGNRLWLLMQSIGNNMDLVSYQTVLVPSLSSWAPNVSLGDYAPNGPADVNICSGENLCRWVC